MFRLQKTIFTVIPSTESGEQKYIHTEHNKASTVQNFIKNVDMRDVKYPTQQHATTQDSNYPSISLTSKKYPRWTARRHRFNLSYFKLNIYNIIYTCDNQTMTDHNFPPYSIKNQIFVRQTTRQN